jgi:hypothetical protein
MVLNKTTGADEAGIRILDRPNTWP